MIGILADLYLFHWLGGGFSFGTPSTQATGNVSFGAAVGQTPAAGPTSSFSFGATPAASTGQPKKRLMINNDTKLLTICYIILYTDTVNSLF